MARVPASGGGHLHGIRGAGGLELSLRGGDSFLRKRDGVKSTADVSSPIRGSQSASSLNGKLVSCTKQTHPVIK